MAAIVPLLSGHRLSLGYCGDGCALFVEKQTAREIRISETARRTGSIGLKIKKV